MVVNSLKNIKRNEKDKKWLESTLLLTNLLREQFADMRYRISVSIVEQPPNHTQEKIVPLS
ncbi:MAG: hypothetical protein N2442_00680 [Spirochaetes bacterium]|nr:hypothetical protein [Spirochaetota bacterium]